MSILIYGYGRIYSRRLDGAIVNSGNDTDGRHKYGVQTESLAEG